MSKTQWPGWETAEQAEQFYLVHPRALAGGGDIRHVREFLRASGWRDSSRPGGLLALQSPDRTVRIAYAPHEPPGGWLIHGAATGHDAEWWAYLGMQTPVEIVAGLTDALTRSRSAHAPNVWAPLEEQNWNTHPRSEHYTATSPDGTTWMQYHQAPDREAIWWSGAKDGQGNGWSAQFSASTPMHLVAAFATELASPEPVMRPRGRIPLSTLIRSRSVSVRPSQLSAWQQARITAARAATWARNSPRTGRPPTTARPHAAPNGARTRR